MLFNRIESEGIAHYSYIIGDGREAAVIDPRLNCGSGLRSMIAARLLKREGWQNLVVVPGGLAGWRSVSFPNRRN